MTSRTPRAGGPRSLAPYVHEIRTSGRTDAYWAKLLKIGKTAIRQARIGDTYRNHRTPPDVRRRRMGKYVSSDARFVPVSDVTSCEISMALRRWRAPAASHEGASQ